MYKLGGSGGGRGGGTKRPPAPHGRGRGVSSSKGGAAPPPRGRAAAAGVSPEAQAERREESFSLESSGPPAFAALIRLTPDLVDEIRRAEEAGGGARIMFNSSINSAENIIDVDGKEFNFSWSSEPGLCDIYEERQSGEGGNGLLMERGAAWRKVNVQRILDESAKNTVKMRSEEAERLSKSRKSIVLDPMNPSVKIQAKSMAAAAVEGNMRRMKWNQKEHFKKNQGLNPLLLSNRTPFRNLGPISCPAIDTSVIAFLIDLKKATEKGLELVLVNPTGEVMEKIQRANNAHDHFRPNCLYLTTGEAIASLSGFAKMATL